jgi:hypothetical protein
MTLQQLQSAPLLSFDPFPASRVVLPQVAAGVYAIYRGPTLYYVGMAGKMLKAGYDADGKSPKGLRQRLNAHRLGLRSGNQFCIYICDREIVPRLSATEQAAVGEGAVLLDKRVREFVAAELTFRVAVVSDGRAALDLERAAIEGGLGQRPVINAWAASRSR